MNCPHPLTPVLIETQAEETSARFQSLLPNLGEAEPESYSPQVLRGFRLRSPQALVWQVGARPARPVIGRGAGGEG